MVYVQALWRSFALDTNLNIKACTWKAHLPSSFVFSVHKHTFWKGLRIRKGYFLLCVLKNNFYTHTKSTKMSSDISELSSSILIHFLICFIIETKQRLRIQHWTSMKPEFTSALHHSCGSQHLWNSGVFLLKTIIKEAKKEISIYTFLALLTDFINHSRVYAAK